MAKSNEARVLREIQKRLGKGIEQAVKRAAEGYRERVTLLQSPPPSDPGEYPAEDTGQGAANISYGVQASPSLAGEIEGRFGVLGSDSPIPVYPGQDHAGGEHLDWLRENQGRLGMDSSFASDLNAIKLAFRRGAKI